MGLGLCWAAGPKVDSSVLEPAPAGCAGSGSVGPVIIAAEAAAVDGLLAGLKRYQMQVVRSDPHLASQARAWVGRAAGQGLRLDQVEMTAAAWFSRQAGQLLSLMLLQTVRMCEKISCQQAAGIASLQMASVSVLSKAEAGSEGSCPPAFWAGHAVIESDPNALSK